jgi:UDP-glucose 4-epimerase
MIEKEEIIINGDGNQTRDYVYVSDIVKASLLAQDPKIRGIFNIGTGRESDVNTIFHKLAQILSPQLQEIHGPEKIGEQRRSVLDSAKAKHQLGWTPAIELDQGLEKTARYFQEK